MASIGWIDFSPTHRNRVGAVLDMLRPEGMVDELGLGTIRDALANEIFPGISTIQTRAKYFFIIPYILYDYQNSSLAKRSQQRPSKFLEEREYEIMWQLAEKYNYIEGHGVIGISKRKPNKIVRRPSAIYWNGLHTFQFINTSGLSAEIFLKKAVNPSIETLISSIKEGDEDIDDIDAEYENLFKIKVPQNLNWKNDLTLELSKDEASFFKDHIISVSNSKLLSELLINEKLWEIFLKSENFMEFAKSAVSLSIPDNIKAILIQAHDFSELVYGAHIAYNCLLHKKAFNSDYHDLNWSIWLKSIQNNMLDYKKFDPDILLGYALRTKGITRKFVKEWWKQTQSYFNEIGIRDAIVQQQEANVKGNKARLRWSKMDDVKENDWLGLKHFNYRFDQAKTILTDIRNGIQNEHVTS